MSQLIFNSPGNIDNLSNELKTLWNKKIVEEYDRLKNDWGSDFFELDPNKITNATTINSIKWFADPAEADFCKNADVAQKLSDWGFKGRHFLHNEYCEYVIVYSKDSNGKKRPKRVQVTTELMEYWMMLAINDPKLLKSITESIIKRTVNWQELYGEDPMILSETERSEKFKKTVIGYAKVDSNGQSQWINPESSINVNNALFMSHGINGLDDLLYIVMFGARPYAKKKNGEIQKVSKEELFLNYNVKQLACRHADPAAAMGAYNAVYSGRKVAFNKNLGMYIQTFTTNSFSYQGNQIPESWIKLSRGEENTYQRLEFGPSDQEDIFLDDIMIEKGGVDVPLIGGFQVLQNIEVGPFIEVGIETKLNDADYIILDVNSVEIKCNEASICSDVIEPLWKDYNGINFEKIAPRQINTY